MLFDRATELYTRHLKAQHRSPLTLSWYAEQFAAYRKWTTASELPTAEEIDAFLADQHDSGLRPATVNARFRALRALLLWLEKRRYIGHDANPIHMLEAPAMPHEVRRYVTAADFDRLLAAAASSAPWVDVRDRLLLHVLYYSGLRLTECSALMVADVDTDQLLITVHSGKGAKARIVPCHPDVRRLAAEYLLTRPAHTPALWLASDGYGGYTGQLTREGIRQLIKRRCYRAGITPAYSPHSFRHGFAMWAINAGVRLTTVATLMGHADSEITQRVYAHTTAATARKEYDQALWVKRNT
jgi:site-specific recombinase XerD